jgi:hypothetical protein
MKQREQTDAERVMQQIEAALPGADAAAVSLLLTATAAKVVDAGISDARAVSGLITSLKSVREQIAKRRAH